MADQTGFPTAAVNLDNGVTGARNWQNVSDALTDNALYAFSTFDSTGTVTKYLYLSDYNFSIPSDATVTGFTVTVQKRASGTAQDHFVGLAYPDGTNVSITFPGKQEGTNWTSGEGTSNYGNSNDPWNKTWTYSEVNDQNFGVVISAQGASGSSPLIDTVKIAVAYHRIYADIATGGAQGGGSGTNVATFNVTGSGGGVVSRLSTYDVDGTGGAVAGGLSDVFTVNEVTVQSNQIAFVCNGAQVVPANSATETVHASLTYDAVTNVVRWYINNTISGVDTVRFRNGAEGVFGNIRINVDSLQDVSVNPIIGQTTVSSDSIAEIQAGTWNLVLTDNDTGKSVRGQVVNRASISGDGTATRSVTTNVDATGGLILGGRAFFIWSDDATGGVSGGGEAYSAKSHSYVGTGGAIAGGSGPEVKSIHLNGSGGTRSGGLSILQANYGVTAASSGVEAAGLSPKGIYIHLESAGVSGGGAASPLNISNVVASGGAEMAGAININMFWLHNPVGDGGGVCGGDARKERIRELQKAIITGIGNSLFSDNILKVVPNEGEKLFPPHTEDEMPELPEQVYFETSPGWCFVYPNFEKNNECCSLVGEDDTVVCDASIPKILERRQRGYLPPQKRTDTARDRKIATAQVNP